MNHFQSHTKKHPLKCNKKRLTQDQIRLLESSFNFNKKLDSDQKFQLSQELGVPQRQVSIWYQNKRARWKNQSLEIDYKALQSRLEKTLAYNRRLESEIESLKQELDKVQSILVLPNTPYSFGTSLSTSCSDAVGSPSLIEIPKHQLDDKEIYDCLIGTHHDQGDQYVKSNGRDFFASSVS